MFDRLRKKEPMFSPKSQTNKPFLIESPTKSEAKRLVSKLFDARQVIGEVEYRSIVNASFAELQDRG